MTGLYSGIAGIGDALLSGRATCGEVVTNTLARIRAMDPLVGAFSNVRAEAALAEASVLDEELAVGASRGPLHGVPFAVKDQFNDRDCPSFMSRRADPGYGRDAAVIDRLRHAGAVYVGKLVMANQPDQAQPRNPWNLEHATGGSSSGAGAAVAAGLVPISVGEDSAGSARAPASYCGIVGLVPQYGTVSRFGMAPMAPSMDRCAVMATTVGDCLIALKAMTGPDPRDPATLSPRTTASDTSTSSLGNVRVGVLDADLLAGEYGVTSHVLAAYEEAVDAVRRFGCQVVEIEEPPSYVTTTWVAFALFAHEYAAIYGDSRDAFVRSGRLAEAANVVYGRLVRKNDYRALEQVRARLTDQIEQLRAVVDVLVTPTMPTTAPRLSEAHGWWWKRPGFLAASSLVGTPALTLPAGLDPAGLPIGLQLLAPGAGSKAWVHVAERLEAEFNFGTEPEGAPMRRLAAKAATLAGFGGVVD